MLLLSLFAFVAGAATAVSPCALPVLPVVFAAGTTGGRRRPAGIATGLAIAFTFAVVVLVYVISAFGLPDSLIRTFAIAVLLVFGLSLMVPRAAAWVEFRISAFTSRGATKLSSRAVETSARRDGFWSGVVVGGGLGLVYAPCAGPILAGVITATASQSFSSGRLLVALSYALGSALTFYALMLGGRRLTAPLAKRSAALQVAMGAMMVVVAIAMFANLDTRFQSAIAADLPAFLVNPTGGLEKSSSVSDRLAATGGGADGIGRAAKDTEVDGRPLPTLGVAPEFTGNQKWFNTADGRPLTLRQLRGKVVLIDFWTYTCINCIRTLPHLKQWHAKYADKGLVVVGVHTPEFPFEKSAANVRSALEQRGLKYPVVQDNEFKTWDAYGNQFWPAKYLIDASGNVRYTHFGEGDYAETETAVRALLAEDGVTALGKAGTKVSSETASDADLTPELYLGSARADAFVNGPISKGLHNYGSTAGNIPLNHLRYSGRWRISEDAARASGPDARIDLNFNARRVFLVLGSGGGRRPLGVELDGRPISSEQAGSDVRNGVAMIGSQRLYRLVDLPDVQRHTLTLRPAAGVTGYAFTFG